MDVAGPQKVFVGSPLALQIEAGAGGHRNVLCLRGSVKCRSASRIRVFIGRNGGFAATPMTTLAIKAIKVLRRKTK